MMLPEPHQLQKVLYAALAGIAIRENFITGKDQKLKEFFPEIDWESTDPLKSEITVEQILQMSRGIHGKRFMGIWKHYLIRQTGYLS